MKKSTVPVPIQYQIATGKPLPEGGCCSFLVIPFILFLLFLFISFIGSTH